MDSRRVAGRDGAAEREGPEERNGETVCHQGLRRRLETGEVSGENATKSTP